MKEKAVLKSAHPDEYPDLVIECKVIPNDKIGKYLDSIPDDKKFYAFKSQSVKAGRGNPGEVIDTVLTTVVDGKEYILSEESTVVQERLLNGKVVPDVVVTNDRSTSNEEYVVKFQKFANSYDLDLSGDDVRYKPKYDSRLLTEVDENIIIMTAWGSPALCLAGGYIVTYDAESCDYNTLEKGAFNSTYTRENPKTRPLKK